MMDWIEEKVYSLSFVVGLCVFVSSGGSVISLLIDSN
jgi:hypothetical protein